MSEGTGKEACVSVYENIASIKGEISTGRGDSRCHEAGLWIGATIVYLLT